MANKKSTAKKNKEKINKAKQILETNSKNMGVINFEKEVITEEENKEVLDNNENTSDTSKIDPYEEKELQGISYVNIKKSFEKGFLYLKTLRRCQESVLPYKIYLMENTLYQVKDLDLEDEAFYIMGEGDLYIKVMFDDVDFQVRAEGIS